MNRSARGAIVSLTARGNIHGAAGIAGCDPQNRDVSRDFASRGSFAALAARGKKATIAFFPGMLGIVLVFTILAPSALAQITGVVSSDVEAFFGSQSDTFQLSEPPIGPSWPANGVGPYPVTGPNVPPLYPGFPNPSLSFAPNIPYDLGHTGPGFTDSQLTTSNYSVIGNYSGGTFTGDAFAMVFGPPMSLNQPASATGFAYEKAEFVMTYSVGPSGIAAGPAPAYPFLVTGNVLPGGYAQFGAQVDYWWQPVIPGTIIPSGPAVNLGTLQYNFLQPGGGAFGTVVNHSPTVLAGATGVGFLQITGEMFVAGDPFSINVISIPEPSTMILGLAGFGTVGMIALRSKRRRRERILDCQHADC